MYLTKWAILLSMFWLLLSGYIQPLMLGFGAASVAVVLVILKRMDDIDKEPLQNGTGLQIIRYLPFLIGQIIRSSLQVTQLIWRSPVTLTPALAKVKTKHVPRHKRVLYANSITLTPGTLAVDLVNDELTVHALQESSIDELAEGEMEKKIASIWGKNK
ncbi:cation transporter [Thalassotalea sp. HSM 43]|uniref:Na+/H+ antiporter subunit E n=1 Tax=Thalassotalea sp. HSM 43 TaxID=2552945 RepID=UPI00108057D9|nr:Na+/H+ antiporter subunit E [Thalassotalea sp. HSM 43]QBY04073.1 cation transporter [Thalassotalea sp. HSM 43]